MVSLSKIYHMTRYFIVHLMDVLVSCFEGSLASIRKCKQVSVAVFSTKKVIEH